MAQIHYKTSVIFKHMLTRSNIVNCFQYNPGILNIGRYYDPLKSKLKTKSNLADLGEQKCLKYWTYAHQLVVFNMMSPVRTDWSVWLFPQDCVWPLRVSKPNSGDNSYVRDANMSSPHCLIYLFIIKYLYRIHNQTNLVYNVVLI